MCVRQNLLLILKKGKRFFILFFLSFSIICNFELFPQEFSQVFKFGKKIILDESKEIFSSASDLDIDSKDNVWVIDFNQSKLFRFNKNGSPKTIATRGRGPGELYMPNAIFIDAKDRIFVASYMKGVSIFDSNGTFLDAFIPTDGHIPTTDICVNSIDDIILGGRNIKIDQKTNKQISSMIHVYSLKGKYKNSFCPINEKIKRLNLIPYTGVFFSIDDKNNIYTIQPIDYKISIFDMNGSLKKTLRYKPVYYKEPVYLSDRVIRDDKLLDEYTQSFHYILDIFVNGNKFIIVSQIQGKNKTVFYYIDIYDVQNEKNILSGIKTNKRLFRVKNGNYYFREIIPTDNDDELKSIEVYNLNENEK